MAAAVLLAGGVDASAFQALEPRLVDCIPAAEPVPDGPPDPASPCFDNVVPGPSTYVPAPIEMRADRPYMPLDDYLVAPADNPVVQRFTEYVDAAVASGPDGDFSAVDAVIMHARTGEQQYLDLAVELVEAEVVAAEEAIAAGERPEVAGDSYLHVGSFVEQLAVVYDWAYEELEPLQRERWERLGQQAVSNVWSPRLATWGDDPAGAHAWSGWAINDVGNNYNFSFMLATQAWALATHDEQWVEFLQQYKFPLITDYYQQLRGGGSREGTGYGLAMNRLWSNAHMLAVGTGEHLAEVEQHARESIDYWVHATVPTRDMYAPIGDLARESTPNLYDTHETLMIQAAMSAPGTPQAGRALWWIHNNSVPATLAHGRNLRGALLQPVGSPTPPTATTYHARGVGAFFARSGWGKDAAWLNVVAGPYDQSHAHQNQGAFTLYRGRFRVAGAGTYSHSGLQGNGNAPYLGTEVGNLVRFVQDGETVEQGFSRSRLTTRRDGGTVVARADLTPAYAHRPGAVRAWTRRLEMTRRALEVRDRCEVGRGVSAVWQAHVPVKPEKVRTGSVAAGGLRIDVPRHYRVRWTSLSAIDADFLRGWRLEVRNPRGCRFDVDLRLR